MRHLIMTLSALLMLSYAAPGAAQETPAPDSAASTKQTSPELNTAFEGVFRLFLYDSGIFDRIMEAAIPQLRQQIEQSPPYRRATAAHRAALTAFAQSLPTVFREEVDAILPTMAAGAADRINGVLTADDLDSYVTFWNRSEMHSIFTHYIDGYMRDPNAAQTNPDLNAAQMAAFTAYSETPEGRRVIEHNGELIEAMTAQLNATQTIMSQRLAIRMRDGMCAALGDECAAFGLNRP